MEVTNSLVVTPSEDSQKSLDVYQAIDGDANAFGRIYQSYVDRIYRYVYYQVGNAMLAEDITEEVFIKAWKSIRNCKGREETFTAWLYRIAHNHAIETMRKSQREISVEEVFSTDQSDPVHEAENRMELNSVLKAIQSLPEKQQQVIRLKFLDDNENDEISRIMGQRQGAVRALQMRALISLRKKFASGADSNGR
jgi:RNA polymerase sigma-70 factor, ECF subfamily